MRRRRCTLILTCDNLGGRVRDHRLLASSADRDRSSSASSASVRVRKFRDFFCDVAFVVLGGSA